MNEVKDNHGAGLERHSGGVTAMTKRAPNRPVVVSALDR
jgi:hypothetical protein